MRKTFSANASADTATEVLDPVKKLTDYEERLIKAVKQAGIAVENLPYTVTFNNLMQKFSDPDELITTIDCRKMFEKLQQLKRRGYLA